MKDELYANEKNLINLAINKNIKAITTDLDKVARGHEDTNALQLTEALELMINLRQNYYGS